MSAILWFLLGFVIGWLTKIPFLLKWYKELKQTRDYQRAMLEEKIKKYNQTNPPC